MARFNLCAASYQSAALTTDAQLTVNLFPEHDESGQGKSEWSLLSTPGLAFFANIPGNQNRGGFIINGRVFSVVDAILYEVFADKTFINRGAVANDGQRVSMVASSGTGAQLLIASAGIAYVLNLNTNVLTPLDPLTFAGPVLRVGFSDGFFIALVGAAGASPAQFYVSQVLNATNWALNGSKIISTYPDNPVSMIIDHRELCIFGPKQSEFEYDSGNTFPFDTVPSGFMEQGIAAADSAVKLDNSFLWLGGNADQGQGIFWKSSGYTPQRVSNHAIENEIKKYATISDARSYGYQDGGHSFYVTYFPTANKTLVLDLATGLWCHRQFGTGPATAHRSQWHIFAFGQHLVGDWKTGAIYTMSDSIYTDFGNPILRLRRSPVVAKENKRMFFSRVDLDMETGVGPQPPLLDGANQPRGPIVSLRVSRDGAGKTWGNYYDRDFGQAGEYFKHVFWARLGSARKGAIFEISCADPVPVRITDAYLEGEGFQASERLVHQLRKSA